MLKKKFRIIFRRKANREIPNETTIAAIQEAEEEIKHPGKLKHYSSVDEMMADLNILTEKPEED